MFERSKSESLCDVSVARIGHTFSYGFKQTDLVQTLPNPSEVYGIIRFCCGSIVFHNKVKGSRCIESFPCNHNTINEI